MGGLPVGNARKMRWADYSPQGLLNPPRASKQSALEIFRSAKSLAGQDERSNLGRLRHAGSASSHRNHAAIVRQPPTFEQGRKAALFRDVDAHETTFLTGEDEGDQISRLFGVLRHDRPDHFADPERPRGRESDDIVTVPDNGKRPLLRQRIVERAAIGTESRTIERFDCRQGVVGRDPPDILRCIDPPNNTLMAYDLMRRNEAQLLVKRQAVARRRQTAFPIPAEFEHGAGQSSSQPTAALAFIDNNHVDR